MADSETADREMSITADVTSFSSPEVVELTGATARQLVYWIDQGVLEPSIEHRRGSGGRHRWSAGDVRVVKVLAELVRLGADVGTLRLVPEVLEHHCGEGWLLVGPGRVRLCTIEELVDALTHDEPGWHVVRLTTVLHELPNDDVPAAR